MPGKTKITLEQIDAVKKRLRKLPVKNTARSKDEAMKMLVTDFQTTLKKGYTLKELQNFLNEEGVSISTCLLNRTLEAKRKTSQRDAESTSAEPDVKIKTPSDHAIIVKPDTPDEEL